MVLIAGIDHLSQGVKTSNVYDLGQPKYGERFLKSYLVNIVQIRT